MHGLLILFAVHQAARPAVGDGRILNAIQRRVGHLTADAFDRLGVSRGIHVEHVADPGLERGERLAGLLGVVADRVGGLGAVDQGAADLAGDGLGIRGGRAGDVAAGAGLGAVEGEVQVGLFRGLGGGRPGLRRCGLGFVLDAGGRLEVGVVLDALDVRVAGRGIRGAFQSLGGFGVEGLEAALAVDLVGVVGGVAGLAAGVSGFVPVGRGAHGRVLLSGVVVVVRLPRLRRRIPCQRRIRPDGRAGPALHPRSIRR